MLKRLPTLTLFVVVAVLGLSATRANATCTTQTVKAQAVRWVRVEKTRKVHGHRVVVRRNGRVVYVHKLEHYTRITHPQTCVPSPTEPPRPPTETPLEAALKAAEAERHAAFEAKLKAIGALGEAAGALRAAEEAVSTDRTHWKEDETKALEIEIKIAKVELGEEQGVVSELRTELAKVQEKEYEAVAAMGRAEGEVKTDEGLVVSLCPEAGGHSEWLLNSRGEAERMCVLEGGSRVGEE